MPALSITFSVTVLGPILAQVKVTDALLLICKEPIPQASLLPLSIMAAVTVTVPEGLSATTIFLHTAVGAVLSITVLVFRNIFNKLDEVPLVEISGT